MVFKKLQSPLQPAFYYLCRRLSFCVKRQQNTVLWMQLLVIHQIKLKQMYSSFILMFVVMQSWLICCFYGLVAEIRKSHILNTVNKPQRLSCILLYNITFSHILALNTVYLRTSIIYLSRVLCLSVCDCVCVCVTICCGTLCYSVSFSNQIDQGDQTEGLEREG